MNSEMACTIYFRRIGIIIKFSPQRKDRLLFLPSNMAAVTLHVKQPIKKRRAFTVTANAFSKVLRLIGYIVNKGKYFIFCTRFIEGFQLLDRACK